MLEKAKKQIYIHIGTEKTGTKSIQNYCSKNAMQLQSEGILYPINQDRKYVFNNTHWSIVASIAKLNAFLPESHIHNSDQLFKELIEDINATDAQKILLSAEPFSVNFRHSSEVAKLGEYLKDFDVKIILYIRRQDDYFVSHTSTKVKGGVYIPDFKISINEVLKDKVRYDYSFLTKMWGDVFGEENIIIRRYDKEKLVNGDIIDDFLEIFDLDRIVDPNTSKRHNKSLSLESLYFLNEVNGKTDLSKEERTKIFRKLEDKDAKYPISAILSVNDRDKINHYYQKSNESVIEKFFPGDVALFNDKYPADCSVDDVKGEFFNVANYLLGKKQSQTLADLMLEKTLNMFLEELTVEVKGKEILNAEGKFPLNVAHSANIKVFSDTGYSLDFEALTHDPIFVLSNKEPYNNQFVLVVRMESNVETVADLFYRGTEGFSAEKSVQATVKKGMNDLVFKVSSDIEINEVRFDPSRHEGTFSIKAFNVINL